MKSEAKKVWIMYAKVKDEFEGSMFMAFLLLLILTLLAFVGGSMGRLFCLIGATIVNIPFYFGMFEVRIPIDKYSVPADKEFSKQVRRYLHEVAPKWTPWPTALLSYLIVIIAILFGPVVEIGPLYAVIIGVVFSGLFFFEHMVFLNFQIEWKARNPDKISRFFGIPKREWKIDLKRVLRPFSITCLMVFLAGLGILCFSLAFLTLFILIFGQFVTHYSTLGIFAIAIVGIFVGAFSLWAIPLLKRMIKGGAGLAIVASLFFELLLAGIWDSGLVSELPIPFNSPFLFIVPIVMLIIVARYWRKFWVPPSYEKELLTPKKPRRVGIDRTKEYISKIKTLRVVLESHLAWGIVMGLLALFFSYIFVYYEGLLGGAWLLITTLIAYYLYYRNYYYKGRVFRPLKAGFVGATKFHDSMWNTKFSKKVEGYMRKIRSKSKPWFFNVFFVLYIVTLMLVFPQGGYIGPRARFADVVAGYVFLGLIHIFFVYFMNCGFEVYRAISKKRLCEFFKIPKESWHIKPPKRPFSISCISSFCSVGVFVFSVGVILIINTLLGNPIFGAGVETPHILGTGIALIILGGLSIVTGYGLWKMGKEPALLAIVLSILPFAAFPAPFIDPITRIPLPPAFNAIWWFGIPLVILYFIKKHWHKLR